MRKKALQVKGPLLGLADEPDAVRERTETLQDRSVKLLREEGVIRHPVALRPLQIRPLGLQ